MTLNKVRKDWEKGLTPLMKTESHGTVLVVLRKNQIAKDSPECGPFDCHRYFNIRLGTTRPILPLEEEWVVSVDKKAVRVEEVFKWIESHLL